MTDAEALLEQAIGGDRRSLARLLSVVEAGGDQFRAIAPKVFAAGRGAHSIGLTGAPGAGKSSLTDALVAAVRLSGSRVAVVAVDPSSPLSGGAILGDRVRLREQHAVDDDVYVRSMASRGQLGGLSLAVPEVVRALDAAGWPVVIIETVGVGQSEVAIAENADTTVVVVNPGWGDEVQANKAGLLEIADVLVVNKADRPGVESTVHDLERMLHLGKARAWTPVIVTTVATDGAGVDRLWSTIAEHQAFLLTTGELDRRRAQRRVAEARQRALHDVAAAVARAERSTDGEQVLADLVAGIIDPVTASARLARLI